MINFVIFDLDGTLLDTSEGIVESARYTVDSLGYEPLSEEALYSFIGPPLRQSFIRNCGCTPGEALEATMVFREYYNSGAMLKASPYNGIMELCRSLREKKIKMAVATNKPERFAVKLLQHFSLDEFFDAIHGADEKSSLSKSDLIKKCIVDVNATMQETVLIGDTTNDAKGAEEANIRFLAVTYGFGSKEEMVHYSNIGLANAPSDILNIVQHERETK